MVYIHVYFRLKARESVFSSRPFKQRPTNSSQPLSSGRKTRRSHSVKFESAVWARKSGAASSCGEEGVQHTIVCIVKFVLVCFFSFYLSICSHCTAIYAFVWLLEEGTGGLSTGEKSWTPDCFSPSCRYTKQTMRWRLLFNVVWWHMKTGRWDFKKCSSRHGWCFGFTRKNESVRDGEIKRRLEDVDMSASGSRCACNTRMLWS